MVAAGPGSPDLRDAALRREFPELKEIVARDDAVHGAGEMDHALLILDIRGLVRFAERGAAFVLGEVAVEVAIVGSEDEGRVALDADVLRGEGVAGARVGA